MPSSWPRISRTEPRPLKPVLNTRSHFPLVADYVVADVDLGDVVVERYVEHEAVVRPRTELQMARLHHATPPASLQLPSVADGPARRAVLGANSTTL